MSEPQLIERHASKWKRRILSALAAPAGRLLCEAFGESKDGARNRGRTCLQLARSLASQQRISEARIFAANGILAEPSNEKLNWLNLELSDRYAKSLLAEDLAAEIETYCCFVGYPRSGHSLLAALLDAHPEMLISNELHALQFLDSKLPPRSLFAMIAENSRVFAFAGRSWSGYSYAVPGMWQGSYKKLKIIGDKKGSRTAAVLQQCPDGLQRFSEQIDKPIKVLHVYRNPFDNIATICLRNNLAVDAAAEKYFAKAETVRTLKEGSASDGIIDVPHESLIADPRATLSRTCEALGVHAEDDYLSSCAALINQSPRKSRHRVTWSEEQKRRVRNRLGTFAWLRGYDFDD
jgi:hypothetical protein